MRAIGISCVLACRHDLTYRAYLVYYVHAGLWRVARTGNAGYCRVADWLG